jgi:hypothetical protein
VPYDIRAVDRLVVIDQARGLREAEAARGAAPGSAAILSR